MEGCVFCKIVRGELPSYKLLENDKFYAFLSIGPHKSGHTLVIPKTHFDDFFEMDDDNLKNVLIFSKPIASAIKKAFIPKSGKVGLVVAGLEIPHAHLHLIPMDNLADLDFANARKATGEELLKTQDKLKKTLRDA